MPLNDSSKEQLKKKYETLINDLTKEIRRQKKAINIYGSVPPLPPDDVQNAKLDISKFQRALLLKIHKEGEYSDGVIRNVERELDIDELKLNQTIPKQEV